MHILHYEWSVAPTRHAFLMHVWYFMFRAYDIYHFVSGNFLNGQYSTKKDWLTILYHMHIYIHLMKGQILFSKLLFTYVFEDDSSSSFLATIRYHCINTPPHN